MGSPVGRVAALGAAGLLQLAACRQVLGIDTRTEGDPPLALGAACGTCVEATCSEAERACAADSECAAAAACMAQAGQDNPFARAACREQHPKATATSAFAAIDSCMRTDCQADCYGGSGFFAAYSSECQACAEARCDDRPSRCVADAECEALAVDAYESGPAGHNPATLTALTGAPGEAGEVKRLMGYCPISFCPSECGFDGSNLACVSGYQWPRSLPASALVELEVLVFNPEDWTSTPLPKTTVDVCQPASDHCIQIDSVEADATGLATVRVPLDHNAGFRGFFRLEDHSIDGQDTAQMHLFAYPLVRDVRGLAPTFRWKDVEFAATVLAGGLQTGKAQVAIQFFDCSVRQTESVTLSVPQSVLKDPSMETTLDAKIVGLDDGLFAIYNANPGCFDVVGHDAMGNETHRMRLLALPDVGTWAYVFPRSEGDAPGYTCTPDYE